MKFGTFERDIRKQVSKIFHDDLVRERKTFPNQMGTKFENEYWNTLDSFPITFPITVL